MSVVNPLTLCIIGTNNYLADFANNTRLHGVFSHTSTTEHDPQLDGTVWQQVVNSINTASNGTIYTAILPYPTVPHASHTHFRITRRASQAYAFGPEQIPVGDNPFPSAVGDLMQDALLRPNRDRVILIQLMHRLKTAVEAQSLLTTASWPHFVHYLLDRTMTAVMQLYEEIPDIAESTLLPLVEAVPQLAPLPESPDSYDWEQAPLVKQEAYALWLNFISYLTCNMTLQAIDALFMQNMSNPEFFFEHSTSWYMQLLTIYSGPLEVPQVNNLLTHIPHLSHADIQLDSWGLEVLLNTPLPRFLQKLTIRYKNGRYGLSGDQVSQALQKLTQYRQLHALELISEQFCNGMLYLSVLQLHHLDGLLEGNQHLSHLMLTTPINDPRVIQKLHTLFPYLQTAYFHLSNTKISDQEAMRAAVRNWSRLQNRMVLYAQLWSIADETWQGSEEAVCRQQQEIVTELIQVCLPTWSAIQQTVLADQWKRMILQRHSHIDCTALVSLLFCNDGRPCLMKTREYNNPRYGPRLRQAIGQLLQDLPYDTELYATCAAYAHEAQSSCGDKCILAFRDCLKAVQLASLLKNPASTTREALIKLGVALFHEEQIKSFVTAHLKRLKKQGIEADEVEEQLALLTGLVKQGQLDLVVPLSTMQHRLVARIDYQHIKSAQAIILAKAALQTERGASIGLAALEEWRSYLNRRDSCLPQRYNSSIMEPLYAELQRLDEQSHRLSDGEYQQRYEILHTQLKEQTLQWYSARTLEYFNSLSLAQNFEEDTIAQRVIAYRFKKGMRSI